MKNALIYSVLFVLIICCSPCRTYLKTNPPPEGTAKLVNSGGGVMSNSAVLLKINNSYNNCSGLFMLPWLYNRSTNCGFNLEIPSGQTTLEVAYKGRPTVKLDFYAQENGIYDIGIDKDSSSCIKVFHKSGNGKEEVSSCGKNVTYNDSAFFSLDRMDYAFLNYNNEFKDCITMHLLKIDDFWGNKKAGLGWGYYYYNEESDIKLNPGKHTLEVRVGDGKVPVIFDFTFESGKTYTLDVIDILRTGDKCYGDFIIKEGSEIVWKYQP